MAIDGRTVGRELNKVPLYRLVDTDSNAPIVASESRIADLESSMLRPREQLSKVGERNKDFDDRFRNGLTLLSSPWNLLKNGSVADKKMVVRLIFPRRLVYDPKGAVRNGEWLFPFKLPFGFCEAKMGMVRPTGFEPVAPRLGI